MLNCAFIKSVYVAFFRSYSVILAIIRLNRKTWLRKTLLEVVYAKDASVQKPLAPQTQFMFIPPPANTSFYQPDLLTQLSINNQNQNPSLSWDESSSATVNKAC